MSNVPFTVSETAFVTSIERALRVFVKVQTTASPLLTGMPVTLRPSPATVPSTCSPSRQTPVDV